MEQVSKIINKMRRIFDSGEYTNIMKQQAEIIFFEEDDGTFSLDSIKFSYYPKAIVFFPQDGIFLQSERGYPKRLLSCSSIENFLNNKINIEKEKEIKK